VQYICPSLVWSVPKAHMVVAWFFLPHSLVLLGGGGAFKRWIPIGGL
jgi:hypothetical protein